VQALTLESDLQPHQAGKSRLVNSHYLKPISVIKEILRKPLIRPHRLIHSLMSLCANAAREFN
jgi:hypothetical protein